MRLERLLLLLALVACSRPDGPEPIAWDSQPCDHCHMLIGERGFAAQLQLTDGRVLSFDDPGCLFRWTAGSPAEIRAVWFHHASEDRWLRGDAVAFRRVAHSPMGYGLAAVAQAEGELDREAAARLVGSLP